MRRRPEWMVCPSTARRRISKSGAPDASVSLPSGATEPYLMCCEPISQRWPRGNLRAHGRGMRLGDPLGSCLRLDRTRSGFGFGLTGRSNLPVFDHQSRDPDHALKVAAHKGRSHSRCVGSYGHVKVLDPNSPAVQVGLDFSELATDLICPRNPGKLIKEQSNASEEALPPLRPWKPYGNPIQLSVVETLGQGSEEHFLPGLQP